MANKKLRTKKLKIKKKYVAVGIIAGMIVVLLLVIFNRPAELKNYDDFAKCLTSKGVKMFGASWCGHCNNQKEAFGDSWKYVTYVECATDVGITDECEKAGIEGFPTWEINGKKYSGEQSFALLAELSGCSLA